MTPDAGDVDDDTLVALFPGEALTRDNAEHYRGRLREQLKHRRPDSDRVLTNGRIPVNPHGGSLAEGATQGSGHIREAVHQLQGRAGARQTPNAARALITAGGFFFNAQGMLLRAP